MLNFWGWMRYGGRCTRDVAQQRIQNEEVHGTPEPADWKEKRRMRAYELKKQSWEQTDIAEALGVTDGAVSQGVFR